jgi:hypothetical protein
MDSQKSLVKVGDLVRIYDPDEHTRGGTPYSALGILIKISQKTSNVNAHRIFTVYVKGEQRVIDEPYWAVSLVSPA